jgi:hypothetical protein
MSEDNWAPNRHHRTNEMKCETCMWFVSKDPEPDPEVEARMAAVMEGEHGLKYRGPLGRCRRRAPTISGFPAVFGTDWCGDHKIDENKI